MIVRAGTSLAYRECRANSSRRTNLFFFYYRSMHACYFATTKYTHVTIRRHYTLRFLSCCAFFFVCAQQYSYCSVPCNVMARNIHSLSLDGSIDFLSWRRARLSFTARSAQARGPVCNVICTDTRPYGLYVWRMKQ